MTASTAPAAKAQIKALLTAALPATRVTWGGPSETEDVATEMVYMDSRTPRNQEVVNLGASKFDEEYTITVIGIGKLEGDNEQAAEQRGWALVDAVEQAVRGDYTLGGVLNRYVLFGDEEVVTEPLPDGWLYRVSVGLVCTATT